MSRYKPRGWRNEPHRHALAAKGIKSKWMAKPRGYFQTKTQRKADFGPMTEDFFDTVDVPELPEPDVETAQEIGTPGQSTGRKATQRIRERQRFEAEVTEQEVRKRPINRILQGIESGRFTQAVDALEEGGLPADDREAIKAALRQQALQQAQAGIKAPEGVLEKLDQSSYEQVLRTYQAAQVEQDRLTEGAGAEALRKVEGELVGAVGEAAAAPGEEFMEGTKFLGDAFDADTQEQGLGKGALLNRIDDGTSPGPGQVDSDLADNPLIDSNAFIGNEEQQTDAFKFTGPIPRLSSNFDFLQDDGTPPTNPVFMDESKTKTRTEVISDQVNALFNSKNQLADVDLSSYDKGNQAFKEGNREKLIAAINDLKAEETTLKDRMTLVEQARRNVTSRENFSDAFKKSSGNFVFDMVSSGGNAIAEQADKINEVRQAIATANEKAFGRRRMLENRLKRLDSTVTPETDIPENVKRFEKEQGMFGSLKLDNPLV